MGFRINLNFLPAEGLLIYFSIAHSSTRSSCFFEWCLDCWQYKLKKYRGLFGIIGDVTHITMLLLAIMDDRLYREPDSHRIYLGRQQHIPQAAHPAILISKRTNQFQFILKHTTVNRQLSNTPTDFVSICLISCPSRMSECSEQLIGYLLNIEFIISCIAHFINQK